MLKAIALGAQHQVPLGTQLLHLHLAIAPGTAIHLAAQGHAEALLLPMGAIRPPWPAQHADRHERERGGGDQPMASPTPAWERLLNTLNLGNHGATAAPLQPDDSARGWFSGLPRFNKPPLAQVPLYQARVLVSLRPSVLDPAGEATRAAASRLGVAGVRRLRIGKAVDVELEAPDQATAQAQLEQLSDRLLANPVIENWQLEIVAPAEVQQA